LISMHTTNKLQNMMICTEASVVGDGIRAISVRSRPFCFVQDKRLK